MATFTGTNNPLTNPKQAAEKFKNQLRKRGGTYQAKAGDSWFKIAGEIYKDYFGGDVVAAQRMAAMLAAANGDIANIRPGMRINLPMPTRNPYVPQGFGGVGGAPATGGANNQTAGASAPATNTPFQYSLAGQAPGSPTMAPTQASYTAIQNAQRANQVNTAQAAYSTGQRKANDIMPPARPPLVTPQARNPVNPFAQNNRPFAMPGEMQPAAAQSQEESRYTGNANSQQARMGYNPAMRGRGYGQPVRPPSAPWRPTYPAQTPEARQRPSAPSVINMPTAQVATMLANNQYPAAINMLDIPAIIPMAQFSEEGGLPWYANQKTRLYVDAWMLQHGYKRSEYGFYVRLDDPGATGGTNPYYTGYRGPGRGYGGGGRGGGGGSYGGYGGSYGPSQDQLRYANESGLVTWRI